MLKHQELINKVIYDFQINIHRKSTVLEEIRRGEKSGSFIKEVGVDLQLSEKVRTLRGEG